MIMKKISNTFRTGKTSVYTLLHYSQMISKKTFLAYNWQEEQENLSRYNINQPPEYNLFNMNVPTVLFWSDQDTFASEADVDRLKKELPQLKMTYKLGLAHIDYLWGQDAPTELYNPICDVLKQYS